MLRLPMLSIWLQLFVINIRGYTSYEPTQQNELDLEGSGGLETEIYITNDDSDLVFFENTIDWFEDFFSVKIID